MDSRFQLKVKFSIYGEDYEWDCSLNWCGNGREIDHRITEWFLRCHDEAYAKFQAELYERDTERREQEAKNKEIAELHRLIQKYGQPNPP